jgi:hypothetical protein
MQRIIPQSNWAYLIALGIGMIGGFAGSVFGMIPGTILWHMLLDKIFVDWFLLCVTAFSILFSVLSIISLTLFDPSTKNKRRFKLAFVAALPWVFAWLIMAWNMDTNFFRLGSTITGVVVGSPALLIPWLIPCRSPSN